MSAADTQRLQQIQYRALASMSAWLWESREPLHPGRKKFALFISSALTGTVSASRIATAYRVIAPIPGPAWAAEPIVSDGDTLTVDGTKYRLDGIDAPEFNQVCLDDKGQEWDCGLAARDALANLIANRAVHCEDKGPDKVHPDRRVGICTFESVELNKWLVREGWALNFEPYAKGRFLPAQADAAKNHRGIWKGCFAAPTDWRHWKKEAPSMGSACPRDAAERIFDCRIKGNQRSKKYHHPGCPSYDSISQKNVAKMFCSEDEARSEGYTKAGNCPP